MPTSNESKYDQAIGVTTFSRNILLRAMANEYVAIAVVVVVNGCVVVVVVLAVVVVTNRGVVVDVAIAVVVVVNRDKNECRSLPQKTRDGNK